MSCKSTYPLLDLIVTHVIHLFHLHLLEKLLRLSELIGVAYHISYEGSY